MKKTIAVMLLAAGCLAAADAPVQTAGVWNGRWWRSADVSMKLGYTAGMGEALTLSTKCRQEDIDWNNWSASVGEIVDLLDQFYAAPENAAIPVSTAWGIVGMKVKGVPALNIETMTLYARKASAKMLAPEQSISPQTIPAAAH